jgi:hypothetical protein
MSEIEAILPKSFTIPLAYVPTPKMNADNRLVLVVLLVHSFPGNRTGLTRLELLAAQKIHFFWQ